MSDLKPCPFCGDSAEVERIGTARQSMVIQCTGCGCRLETGEVPGVSGWRNLSWNRRRETFKLQAEREILVKGRSNWKASAQEKDKKIAELQAENERLRNALINIRDGEYADMVQCESIADEALTPNPMRQSDDL